MITRLLDAEGNVLHDCAQAGCTVSWDGFDLGTGEPVPDAGAPAAEQPEPVGETVVVEPGSG